MSNVMYFAFTLELYVSTYIDALVERMKSGPFSLLIDGSNDTSLDKINPLTVRMYDVSKRQVTTQLLDMCTTSRRDCDTASAIFGKVESTHNSKHSLE